MAFDTSSDTHAVNRSYQVLTFEIVKEILARSSSPALAGEYIADAARELCGAKAVFLLRCQHPNPPRIVAVNPVRRAELLMEGRGALLMGFCQAMTGPALWKAGSEYGAEGAFLAEFNLGDSLIVPLGAPEDRVGALVMFGLADTASHPGMRGALDAFSSLSTLLALILRNAYRFENQQAELAEKSRNLDLSEGAFRSLAALAPAGIFRADAGGRIQFANAKLANIADLASGQVVGLHWTDLLKINERERVLEVWRREAARGHRLSIEAELATAAAPRWALIQIEPEYDQDGAIGALIGVLADITEEKLAEQRQRETETRMHQERRMESLGVLAGGLAHEFNNILMAILGNADLALAELPRDSPTRELIAEIEKASRRGAELTQRMLVYSGQSSIAAESFCLNDIVREMADSLSAGLPHDTRLCLVLSPDNPRIYAGKAQIKQILAALTANAAEAIAAKMPRASQGRIGISTRMTEPGEAISGVRHGAAALDSSRRYACLEVKDNGIGISPENQEKIFDPFYSTKFTGRGLGIPMVLGLVRSHNGAIAVESRPGQGCAIRVYLPAVAQDLSSAPNANAAKGRILFVDDDRSVRELGRIMLSRMGYEVSTAADGIEGLEALKRQADGFDCVLLNASMPRMDGARTLREMRRVREDLPVIVVSGRAEGELREMFAGARLSGMVGKPFRSSDLREKIEAALER